MTTFDIHVLFVYCLVFFMAFMRWKYEFLVSLSPLLLPLNYLKHLARKCYCILITLSSYIDWFWRKTQIFFFFPKLNFSAFNIICPKIVKNHENNDLTALQFFFLLHWLLLWQLNISCVDISIISLYSTDCRADTRSIIVPLFIAPCIAFVGVYSWFTIIIIKPF